MKMRTEHAGPRGEGAFWGRRREVKIITKKARRRWDREEIAMCSRADDPTQYDVDPFANDYGSNGDPESDIEDPYLNDLAAMLAEQGARLRAEQIATARERAAIHNRAGFDVIEETLAADRDDPRVRYDAEV